MSKRKKAAVKAGLRDAIHKAIKHTAKGPEPERFKITGFKNWEDAVKVALKKPKPKGGWPK
jgi:uncharacterized protein YggU (UPF0235/DUF167 family)